jgi:hypothetical protein
MIAELIGNMNDLNTAAKWPHTEVCFYRNPLQDQEAINPSGRLRRRGSIRLPWIHNSDPVDFQSANMLLSKNHFAVPLWCPFQTMWWFVEGSGGESQCRISLWNWSPAMAVSVLADKDRKAGKQTFDLVHFVDDFLK